MREEDVRPEPREPDRVRMPANSLLYERVVPVLLLLLSLGTIVVLLIVLGVLVGLIPYR